MFNSEAAIHTTAIGIYNAMGGDEALIDAVLTMIGTLRMERASIGALEFADAFKGAMEGGRCLR